MITTTDPQPGNPVGNKIRDDAAAAYEQARNNPRLSRLAVRADIGKAYLDAKAKMDAASQTAKDTAARTEQADMRTAFGTPTDPASVMSYRDACDRVANIDRPDEADTLLTRAIAVNDVMLAQAIGLRAFDLSSGLDGMAFDPNQAWGAVLQHYADYRGDTVAAALNRLLQTRGRTVNITDMWAWVLPTPSELAGLQTYEIQRVVDQAQAQ